MFTIDLMAGERYIGEVDFVGFEVFTVVTEGDSHLHLDVV
jgi:hypothetical protein